MHSSKNFNQVKLYITRSDNLTVAIAIIRFLWYVSSTSLSDLDSFHASGFPFWSNRSGSKECHFVSRNPICISARALIAPRVYIYIHTYIYTRTYAYRERLGCTIRESEQSRRADGASNGERIVDEGGVAAGGNRVEWKGAGRGGTEGRERERERESGREGERKREVGESSILETSHCILK